MRETRDRALRALDIREDIRRTCDVRSSRTAHALMRIPAYMRGAGGGGMQFASHRVVPVVP